MTAPSPLTVVTVGRDGCRMANTGNSYSRPIYCTKVYTAAQRADGVWTYRLTSTLPDGVAAHRGDPSNRLIEAAMDYAVKLGVPYVPGVRYGTPVPGQNDTDTDTNTRS